MGTSKKLALKQGVESEVALVEQSYCTKYLSSLFASFLTGGATSIMYIQKYFEVYRENPAKLRSDYEEGVALRRPLISRFPIRVNSTSVMDDVHYATFIATYQHKDGGIENLESDTEDLSIALIVGDMILAVAPFSAEVYRKICNGSRVEIKWKLQLRDLSNILEVVEG